MSADTANCKAAKNLVLGTDPNLLPLKLEDFSESISNLFFLGNLLSQTHICIERLLNLPFATRIYSFHFNILRTKCSRKLSTQLYNNCWKFGTLYLEEQAAEHGGFRRNALVLA
jgi:hypothetical protein